MSHHTHTQLKVNALFSLFERNSISFRDGLKWIGYFFFFYLSLSRSPIKMKWMYFSCALTRKRDKEIEFMKARIQFQLQNTLSQHWTENDVFYFIARSTFLLNIHKNVVTLKWRTKKKIYCEIVFRFVWSVLAHIYWCFPRIQFFHLLIEMDCKKREREWNKIK